MEVELNPVDYITVGTVGPKGKRVFHLQAGKESHIVTLTLEKEQTRALGEAVTELLDDLNERYPDKPEHEIEVSGKELDLREPIEPMFRIAQIGLGYDDTRDMVVIVAQELVLGEEEVDPQLSTPSLARFWGTREQFRLLSKRAEKLVKRGRADPKHNGRIIYYWT